jgi:hypothetical protein
MSNMLPDCDHGEVLYQFAVWADREVRLDEDDDEFDYGSAAESFVDAVLQNPGKLQGCDFGAAGVDLAEFTSVILSMSRDDLTAELCAMRGQDVTSAERVGREVRRHEEQQRDAEFWAALEDDDDEAAFDVAGGVAA